MKKKANQAELAFLETTTMYIQKNLHMAMTFDQRTALMNVLQEVYNMGKYIARLEQGEKIYE